MNVKTIVVSGFVLSCLTLSVTAWAQRQATETSVSPTPVTETLQAETKSIEKEAALVQNQVKVPAEKLENAAKSQKARPSKAQNVNAPAKNLNQDGKGKGKEGNEGKGKGKGKEKPAKSPSDIVKGAEDKGETPKEGEATESEVAPIAVVESASICCDPAPACCPAPAPVCCNPAPVCQPRVHRCRPIRNFFCRVRARLRCCRVVCCN